jgi:hypothetical protein
MTLKRSKKLHIYLGSLEGAGLLMMLSMNVRP